MAKQSTKPKKIKKLIYNYIYEKKGFIRNKGNWSIAFG